MTDVCRWFVVVVAMVKEGEDGVFEDWRSFVISADGAKVGMCGEEAFDFVWSKGEIDDIELEGDEVLGASVVIASFASVGCDGCNPVVVWLRFRCLVSGDGACDWILRCVSDVKSVGPVDGSHGLVAVVVSVVPVDVP